MKKLKIIAFILFFIVGALCVFIFNNTIIWPEWTGFGPYQEITGVARGKTLWDWLELVIVPVAIAFVVFIYTQFEKKKNKRVEDENYNSNLLESFFKTITELLLKDDLKGDLNKKRISIARSRIIMIFGQLDGQRKGQVLQFLYESDLIDKEPMFHLRGANISDAVLDRIVLKNAEIKSANFENTTIQNSNLNEIDLTGCNFKNANLSNSLVDNANFSYTDLSESVLQNLDLSTVDFEGAILTNANLTESTIKQSQLDSIHEKKGINLNKAKIL